MGRIALDKSVTDDFTSKLSGQEMVYDFGTNLSYTNQTDSQDMANLKNDLHDSISDFYTKVNEFSAMVSAVAQNIEDRDNDLSKGWNL